MQLDNGEKEKIRREAEQMTPDEVLTKIQDLTKPEGVRTGGLLELMWNNEIYNRLSVYEWTLILRKKLGL